MKRILSITAIIVSALVVFISACRREKPEDTNAPAYRIKQSESLAIPASIDLPANPPNGNARIATYYAEGVQKYKAQLKAGSTSQYEWVFVAPQAVLYDAGNRKVGTHGAGPFWALSDADSVFGQAYVPAKTAPSLDAQSIDWLLLKPKTGTVPTGIFKNVAYIQRIATEGGKAPATPPASAAETVDVPYKTIYRFSKINL